MVLKGNNLGIKNGIAFLIGLALKSSPNDKMSSLFKREAIYLLKSTHNFAIWGKGATIVHLPHVQPKFQW